jgi:hypothetical protein
VVAVAGIVLERVVEAVLAPHQVVGRSLLPSMRIGSKRGGDRSSQALARKK